MTGSEPATSFGQAADAYEHGRPDYPSAAVAWLLDPVASQQDHPRVADVGAGTGKLTGVLAALGVETVAVDPDAEMLATLHARLPAVPTFVGTAEALPFGDGELDAVVLGQAWHWVEPVAGCAEIARTLRPGGVLGLIWNIRDESVEWVARLTTIVKGSAAERLLAEGDPPTAAPFEQVEAQTWSWSRPVDRATLTALVRSRSYIITAPDEERARVEHEIAALFDDIGAVGDALVELPYTTHAYRSIRP